MDLRPIGVFDSGLGGLTAIRGVDEFLPGEHIVYFGDTGRIPYGTRSRETIIKYSRQDVRFLMTRDVKAIIVACGTVSSVALDDLRSKFDLPITGVVEAACDRARKLTKNGRVGIIGTPATIASGSYEKNLSASDIDCFTTACPLFVPCVENGRTHRGDIVIETLAREYLQNICAAGVDTLILGCTHYPLLVDVLGEIVGKDVNLIDPGYEAAGALAKLLRSRDMLADGNGKREYFVSDSTDNFSHLAELFLHKRVEGKVERVEIENY